MPKDIQLALDVLFKNTKTAGVFVFKEQVEGRDPQVEFIDLQNCKFTGDVNFSLPFYYYKFLHNGEVTPKNASVIEYALSNYMYTVHDKQNEIKISNLHLSKSIFLKKTIFQFMKFHEKLYFYKVKFIGKVYFEWCVFSSETFFEDAIFYDKIREKDSPFTSSLFKGKVSFAGTYFYTHDYRNRICIVFKDTAICSEVNLLASYLNIGTSKILITDLTVPIQLAFESNDLFYVSKIDNIFDRTTNTTIIFYCSTDNTKQSSVKLNHKHGVINGIKISLDDKKERVIIIF
jgi:hypothetical protein